MLKQTTAMAEKILTHKLSEAYRTSLAFIMIALEALDG